MQYTWKFSDQFATEFKQFKEDQQDKVTDFIFTYQAHGLYDFSKYEGKITPSWKGDNISQEDYQFAVDNHLWHYHVGLPEYEQNHPKYKTSSDLLHFQWKYKGNAIAIVDLYRHYKLDGTFYLPPENNLDRE